jgi:ubiquinone/menaquinone biosynthesis C-methylase UbiE
VRRIGLLATGAIVAAALWWRKHPSACPYGQRFWVEAPHPLITRDRLREVLDPRPGERILEIGPGTGYYTLDLAGRVGPDGSEEIFDLQQEFLDHTLERAAERGLTNVVPTQGDATSLPYGDDSVDAVVLTAVLGEIPDRAGAMREIARVLKPDGRLLVGELFGDPHFTTLGALGRLGEAAGLLVAGRSGPPFGYFARLEPPQPG